MQQQIFDELTQSLGVDFDSGSPLEIIQKPGYIDSPVATHDFATAALGALGKATATIGEMRGLGSQSIRVDRRHAGLVLNSIAYHFQEGWQLDISPVHAPVNHFFETKDHRHVVLMSMPGAPEKRNNVRKNADLDPTIIHIERFDSRVFLKSARLL